MNCWRVSWREDGYGGCRDGVMWVRGPDFGQDDIKLSRQGRASLVGVAEVETLVAVYLAGLNIVLVDVTVLVGHGGPLLLLLAVEVDDDLALDNEDDEGKGADGDEHRVALLEVRAVVGAVDLAANETAHLDNDV
ncbi:hypothetical protein BN1723_009043, partial [Verticillium longisporum]